MGSLVDSWLSSGIVSLIELYSIHHRFSFQEYNQDCIIVGECTGIQQAFGLGFMQLVTCGIVRSKSTILLE